MADTDGTGWRTGERQNRSSSIRASSNLEMALIAKHIPTHLEIDLRLMARSCPLLPAPCHCCETPPGALCWRL